MRNGDQPITNGNGLVYSNLMLSGTGNKIAPASMLTVQGNLLKSWSSIFIPNSGTVLLNGNNQTFAGLDYNILLLTNGTKTTSGNSTIFDSLKINLATILAISNTDSITLHSDASRTARVAKVDGSIAYGLNAKFVVERFIPARKAWRFLSIATNSTQTIKDGWQESATSQAQNPRPGYGIQITNNSSNWAANGFDAYSAAGPSMKTYNPSTDSYIGISSTHIPFNANASGYMTFIRGNRVSTTITSPPTAAILRTAGNIFTGPQPDINLVSGLFIPINNYYASSIDLRKLVSSTSVSFYIWDPNRGGNFGFGAVQTLVWNGTDYEVIPGGGSYGLTNNFIESGQAFFGGTLGADTIIKVTENIKASTSFAAIPFTPVTQHNNHLRVNLYKHDSSGKHTLLDGVRLQFDSSYNNDLDKMDVGKLNNFEGNIAIQKSSELLVLERRRHLQTDDTIQLHISSLNDKKYSLEFIPLNLQALGMKAIIFDTYLNKATPLTFFQNQRMDFEFNDQPGSKDPLRFKIISAAAASLPLIFQKVLAYLYNGNPIIEWEIENEESIEYYEIQRSEDGSSFLPIGKNNLNKDIITKYQFRDLNPVIGNNYYRISAKEKNGNVLYSKVVQLLMNRTAPEFNISPNPITNRRISLQARNIPSGLYAVHVLTRTGQLVYSKTNIWISTGTATIPLIIPATHGIYHVKILLPDGTNVLKKIVY
jgi:hypothetical protein